MCVRDCMTSDLTVIPEMMLFDEMLEMFFAEAHITLPIVAESDGTLRGVLTIFDIAQYLHLLYNL